MRASQRLLSTVRPRSRRCSTGRASSDRPPPVKHFVNLSNGAEAIEGLLAAGLPIDQIGFVRIQSSLCERKDWTGVLNNLDDNLLTHLALGFECRIYDYGSASPPYVPRAMWWGMEWSRYALSRLWKLETRPPVLKRHTVTPHFEEAFRSIPEKVRRKVKYYRPFLACTEVNLTGVWARTLIDGQKDVHASMLQAFAAAAREQAASQPSVDPAALGMTLGWHKVLAQRQQKATAEGEAGRPLDE